MDYIIYDGVDSRAFGVYLVRRGNAPLVYNSVPPSRVKTEKIAGRQGTIAVEQTYEPRQIDMQLYFTDTSDQMLIRISSWLGKLGTYKLIKSNEPYKYYNATFEQGLNPEIHGLKQGIVNVTFTAYDPFGYSMFTTLDIVNGLIEYNSGLMYGSGLEYVDLTTQSYQSTVPTVGNEPIEILQGGNADFALPKITIEAGVNGAGGFKLEHFYGGTDVENKVGEIVYSNSIPANGKVVLDSQISDAYDENGDILSQYIEGDFIVLKGFGQPLPLINGSCKLITSTTIQLNEEASSSPTLYVGKTISISNASQMGTKYYKITAYDEVNKIATVGSPINEKIGVGLIYGIYDFSKKLNYIKYTYSAPVVLEESTMTVDFRYTYL